MSHSQPQRPGLQSVWRSLANAFRVAISPSCLLLATVGLLLNLVTWQLSESILGVAPLEAQSCFRLVQLEFVDSALRLMDVDAAALPIDPVIGVPCSIAQPFVRLAQTGQTWPYMTCNLLGGLASICIWSFFGIAIARKAMMLCGREEDLSMADAMRFAKRKWLAVMSAPLATLFAIAMLGLPIFVISPLIRADFGLFLVGCLWIVVLAFAALMAILAIGLVFGWPLMWGAIAAEDSDLFDAISRSFAYTYQRPIHYLLYFLGAASIGFLGWGMAYLISEAVLQLAFWCIQTGGGSERTDLLRTLSQGSTLASDEANRWLSHGGRLIHAGNGLLRLIASGFSYSFFWASTAAIYLLLRFETDQTQLDDVVSRTSGPT